MAKKKQKEPSLLDRFPWYHMGNIVNACVWWGGLSHEEKLEVMKPYYNCHYRWLSEFEECLLYCRVHGIV